MSANVGGDLDSGVDALEPDTMWDGRGVTLEMNQSICRLELSLGRGGGRRGPWRWEGESDASDCPDVFCWVAMIKPLVTPGKETGWLDVPVLAIPSVNALTP